MVYAKTLVYRSEWQVKFIATVNYEYIKNKGEPGLGFASANMRVEFCISQYLSLLLSSFFTDPKTK
jgi:hypothetical protein